MKRENREALNRKLADHLKSSISPKPLPKEKEIRAALNKAQKDSRKKK